MILTPLKIQTAIIKAWYNLALKSIKYYGGLAIGINNDCLLKQARLLRAYIDILKCFKIIGSTTKCNCCIDENYLVTLDNGLIYNFQFLNDNTGTLFNNALGGIFSFDWSQDCNTDNIYLNFPDVFETTYEAVTTLTVDNFVANVATFIGC